MGMKRGSVALFAVCAAACSEPVVPPVGSGQQPIETAHLGFYYELGFAPAPSLAELRALFPTVAEAELGERFARELALQSTAYWSSGAITVRLVDLSTGEQLRAPAPSDSAIRASCGATLIAPSLVITAGHCVASDSAFDTLELEMYRPTPRLVERYAAAAVLSGSFPTFAHPVLGAADGYVVDRYPCRVLSRCYRSDSENCPDTTSDAALLACEGSPGARYGVVNLFRGDPSGLEAAMQWKHEVYDLGDPVAQDFVDHYVLYPENLEQNYHYFEQNNRLLPLRSARWTTGAVPRFVSAQWVDIHGCHGSSGSGILARNGETPEYRLVAPVAVGGDSFWAASENFLCQQDRNAGAPIAPGAQAIGINWPAPDTLLAPHRAAIDEDCRTREPLRGDVDDLPFRAGTQRVSTLFTHLDCQLADYATDGSERLHPPGLSPYPEKYLESATSVEHTVTGFSLENDADYRFGVHLLPRDACTSSCGAITLRAGAAQQSFEIAGSAVRQLTYPFAAAQAGPVQLGFSTANRSVAIGGLVLIREGQVNSFDALEDRLEAALYAPGVTPPRPLPMRFIGDGRAGFEARLRPGERMALLRQALAPGRRWTVRLGATSYQGLWCGLLDMTGAPALRAACSAVFALDDRGQRDDRLGFYVELDATAARTEADIRYVALASDRARDPDEDEVPDVLDNCPGDWNAAQGDCSEEPPQPDAGADSGDGAADAGAVDSGRDAGQGGAGDAAAGTGGTGGTGGAGAGPSTTAGAPNAGPAAGAGDEAGCGCRAAAARDGGAASLLLLGLFAARRAVTGRARRGAGARRGRRGD